MDIEEELLKYNVSRETLAKIRRFVDLLTKWNQKMNLVSKNSLADIWQRHVLDSAQLIDYLPQSINHILDIGSGSGFPAMVLAIMLSEQKPQCRITMVESITKKTVYLNDVRAKLGLNNVEILNGRVENIVFKIPQIITARAVAGLDVLCGYAHKVGGKNTELLLLKGKNYSLELVEAQKHWEFECKVYPNKYSENGVVLKIADLRKKK